MKTNKFQAGEIATTLTVAAVILMLLGTVFGVRLAARPQTTSSFAADGLHLTANNDVTVSFDGPRADRTWDYILSGTLCFTFTPPSGNAQYRVEIVSGSEVLGASVYTTITVPSKAKCGAGSLSFAAPFNLSAENACPDIKIRVDTRGSWPRFNEEIGTIDSSFFCPNRPPTQTPTPTSGVILLTPAPFETVAPTAPVLHPIIGSPTIRVIPRATVAITQIPISAFPELSPTNTAPNITSFPAIPQPNGAGGTISIYACTTPSSVTVSYCDDAASSVCATLPFSTGQTDHGVWLDDTSGDKALIYHYMISKKASGSNLGLSESVYVKSSTARVGADSLNSSAESKNQVRFGDTLDLSIFAESQTCSCNFQSTAYVKNAAGTNILKYDRGLPQFGLANDKQRAIQGDTAATAFSGGKVVTDPVDLNNAGSPGAYGRDHIATVKLYHDNSQINKLVCDSRAGAVPACPDETWQWESSASNVRDTKVFPGLRITCGANIEYGWIIDTSIMSIEGLSIPITKIDLNHDGVINVIDYQMVIDAYGISVQSVQNLDADFNADKVVNAVDLSVVITRLGDTVGE